MPHHPGLGGGYRHVEMHGAHWVMEHQGHAPPLSDEDRKCLDTCCCLCMVPPLVGGGVYFDNLFLLITFFTIASIGALLGLRSYSKMWKDAIAKSQQLEHKDIVLARPCFLGGSVFVVGLLALATFLLLSNSKDYYGNYDPTQQAMAISLFAAASAWAVWIAPSGYKFYHFFKQPKEANTQQEGNIISTQPLIEPSAREGDGQIQVTVSSDL